MLDDLFAEDAGLLNLIPLALATALVLLAVFG